METSLARTVENDEGSPPSSLPPSLLTTSSCSLRRKRKWVETVHLGWEREKLKKFLLHEYDFFTKWKLSSVVELRCWGLREMVGHLNMTLNIEAALLFACEICSATLLL